MPSVSVDFEGVQLSFEHLYQEMYYAIDEEVKLFWKDLVDRNPELSGDMKKSWTFTTPALTQEWVWKSKNAQDYSDIITQGRRKVGNKWYGSIKGWGNAGVTPLLEKMTNNIIRRTNELKI